MRRNPRSNSLWYAAPSKASTAKRSRSKPIRAKHCPRSSCPSRPRFATVEARAFSQLKPTDFIGVTAVPGRNGHLRAEEIYVLPAAMGEGQYPWDHHPASAGSSTSSMGSMTNGTIAAAPAASVSGGSMTNGTVVAGTAAHELNVSYRGAGMVDGRCAGRAVTGQPGCTGTATIDVAQTTPIAAIVPGSPADVKPGLAVVAFILTDVLRAMRCSPLRRWRRTA